MKCFKICTLLFLSLIHSVYSEVEFKVLFDGQSLEGWKQSGNWVIENGTLFRSKRGGGITYDTEKIPDDFELQFEWKVAEKSNSGIYYRPGQYEYQILDNQGHNNGKNPRSSAASLYFCMPPSHDATKPVGEWNKGRIICKGTVIQHWLNGKKVVGFDYTDDKYKFEVELLRKRGADLAARGAKLHLQDHGDPVWYRNIKIRKIGADEKLDRSLVVPAIVPEEQQKNEQKTIDRIMAKRVQSKKK